MVVNVSTAAAGAGLPNYTSVTANPPAKADASYLTYLRALGMQESTALTNLGQNTELTNQQTALRKEALGREGADALRGISGNYEARGVFRSGQHGLALGRQQARNTAAMDDLALGKARALAGIGQQFTMTLGGLATQRAEAEAGLAGRLAQRNVAAPVANSNYTFVYGGGTPGTAPPVTPPKAPGGGTPTYPT